MSKNLIQTLQLSNNSLPVLIVTIEKTTIADHWIKIYAVWPYPIENFDTDISTVAKLGMRLSDDADERGQIYSVLQQSAEESIFIFACSEAKKLSHPAEFSGVKALDEKRLRAWRSLGLYKGLERIHEASEVVSRLNTPFTFLSS